MKRHLTIAVESGETTCASEPGKFCPWARVKRFGTVWVCSLFEMKSLHDDENGWLQRLPECIGAEGRQ